MTDEQLKAQHDHWSETHQLHKYLRWGMGILVAMLISLIAGVWQISEWRTTTESRLDTIEQRADRDRERLAALQASQHTKANLLSRFEERMDAQARSMGRIESTLGQITREVSKDQGD